MNANKPISRNQMIKKADQYVKVAAKAANAGMRAVYLKKARNYYEEAGQTGMAAWCERRLG